MMMVLNQFMFVYPPAHMLKVKKGKDTNYVLSLKSKGVYASKLKPLLMLSCVA